MNTAKHVAPKPPPVWPFPTYKGAPYKPPKVPRPVLPDAPF